MIKISNLFKRFFIWCSGASSDIVLMCDHKEQTKYVNIGIVVLAVAILSSLSSTYFLSFAFNTISTGFTWLYFPVGIVWSFIILSLNRAFVATIDKNDNWFKQILKAVPIFFLTITIGLIVSTPIEFKIFEKEINTIAYDEAKVVIENNIEQKFDKDIEYWENKIQDAEESYLDFKQMYEDEVSGRKSGIPGRGTRADEYMKDELKSKKQLDAYKDSLSVLNQSIIEYYDSFDIDEEVDKYIRENIGVLDRVDILYRLGNVHVILTFLFILIETLPVLIKFLSPRGGYDDISVTQNLLYVKRKKDEYEKELLELDLEKELAESRNSFQISKLRSNNNIEIKLKEAENDIEISKMISENYKDIKRSESENEVAIKEFKSRRFKEIKNEETEHLIEMKNKRAENNNNIKLSEAETNSTIEKINMESFTNNKLIEKQMEINIQKIELEDEIKTKLSKLNKREALLTKREEKLKNKLSQIKSKSKIISETESKASELLKKVKEREEEVERRKEILKSKYDEIKNKEKDLNEWEKSLKETDEKIEKWEKMYWKFKRKKK